MATKKATGRTEEQVSTQSARTRGIKRDVKRAAVEKKLTVPQEKPESKLAAAPRTKSEHRLDVGDQLPNVTLADQQGEPFAMASLRGKRAVVYFYPKDDTPGCTREACSFQESLSKLKRAGIALVGISPDPTRRHAQFAEKYRLKFTLLADPDRNYAKSCGVLVPKTLYGRTSIGIERTTFLVDENGVIRRVWRKVKVDGHVDAVLGAL